MNVLIDTHIAIWTLMNDPHLPDKAKNIIEDKDNTIFYSTVSVWETTIKHMIRPDNVILDGKKLELGCELEGFICLPILNKHAIAVETLKRSPNAPRHKDPFDQLLIAQAKSENLFLLTHDSLIPDYNEPFVILV